MSPELKVRFQVRVLSLTHSTTCHLYLDEEGRNWEGGLLAFESVSLENVTALVSHAGDCPQAVSGIPENLHLPEHAR